MNIEQVVKENSSYIYNYAMKLTCNPQGAEDLAQKTFVLAWQKMETLREAAALRKWLRTICYHQFLMDCRKEHLVIDFVDDVESLESQGTLLGQQELLPEEVVLVDEAVQSLQNGCFYAMARKLTLAQRIAFSMVDMFGLTMEETADMLEISASALKGVLYRARMNLDAFFADHCNLLCVSNPCSCQSWINFRTNHEDNKKKIRTIIEENEFEQKGYHFDRHVRAKISYLYKNLPKARPSEQWFETVIESVKNTQK